MALKINSASGSITLTAEDGSGNADVTLPRGGFVSDLSDLSVTATATELNYVDGVTSNIQTQLNAKGTVSTLADLSITATATELNYVDGVTSNIQTQLDAKGTVSTLADLSVTATASELNLLDGVTATTAELNYIDGVTSNIQTQLDQKAASLSDLSVTASAAELNILDGATLSTTELNYVDGVTSAIQTQIDGKLASTLKGAANGVAELDSSGLVPTSQLPSYVDDVLEYANASSFPGTGDSGKIYVALDTNDIYRWSGSAYVKVSDAVSTADQATALATARTISLSGDVTGSASFDGSADVSITATIADDSHNHVISNVDGLQTALDAKAESLSDLGVTASAAELNYNDITVLGQVQASKVLTADSNSNITMTDNSKLRFGTGLDLQIYHDGSGSFVTDQGSGNLALNGDGEVYIANSADTEYKARFTTNGAVTLYYDNAAKIATTSTGVTVTGNVNAENGHFYKSSGNVQVGVQADSGIGSIEVGGTSGAFVDVKVPYTDDFDTRYANDYMNCTGDYNLQRSGSSKLRLKSNGVQIFGGITEQTEPLTWASSIALSYSNGSIQTLTLAGATTITDSLNDGEAVVLMLNNGSTHTVTWTAVTKWVTGSGNAAPTLTANDTIVLWKIDTTVYAAYTGSYT